ncbi:hypothetical protein [Nocardia jiangxiensis]|uniref:hypothetical protein n=1 Tax=Nocardia jiangxiensis TaxID=282685 RepID=UPI00031D3E10|nr:hypothetical protein [Nocardia jiangxiensis]
MEDNEILRLALKVMYRLVSFPELTGSEIRFEANEEYGGNLSEHDSDRVLARVDSEIKILRQMYSDELLEL